MALIHTDCLSRSYSEKKTNIYVPQAGGQTDQEAPVTISLYK